MQNLLATSASKSRLVPRVLGISNPFGKATLKRLFASRSIPVSSKEKKVVGDFREEDEVPKPKIKEEVRQVPILGKGPVFGVFGDIHFQDKGAIFSLEIFTHRLG